MKSAIFRGVLLTILVSCLAACAGRKDILFITDPVFAEILESEESGIPRRLETVLVADDTAFQEQLSLLTDSPEKVPHYKAIVLSPFWGYRRSELEKTSLPVFVPGVRANESPLFSVDRKKAYFEAGRFMAGISSSPVYISSKEPRFRLEEWASFVEGWESEGKSEGDIRFLALSQERERDAAERLLRSMEENGYDGAVFTAGRFNSFLMEKASGLSCPLVIEGLPLFLEKYETVKGTISYSYGAAIEGFLKSPGPDSTGSVPEVISEAVFTH